MERSKLLKHSVLSVLAIYVLLATVSPGGATSCWVPATADIYLGGQPDGTEVWDELAYMRDSTSGQAALECTGIPLQAGGVLQFSATGSANISPSYHRGDPDGRAGCTITFQDPTTGAGRITVIEEPLYNFHASPTPLSVSGYLEMPGGALIGVFTAETVPPLGTPSVLPGSLDFGATGIGTDFVRIEPELRQIFFIGDGRSSAGVSQRFIVPEGAKHLYLGVADVPGCFNDNPGGFTVVVEYGNPDVSAPAIPTVTDDGSVTPTANQLHATWSSSDPESGIAEYQYAIGTTPTDPGSGYLVDWKSAGTATEATETGLSLQVGQINYWYVKASNGAGLWSEVGVSDGITGDVTCEWQELAALSVARFHLTLVETDGRIFAMGGTAAWYPNRNGTTLNEEYDPVSNQWQARSPLPTPRWGHSAAVVDGKIYVFGGSSAESAPSPQVDVYDPTTDSWSIAAPLPTPRHLGGATVLDSKIYFIGGFTTTHSSAVECYDPVANQWASKAPYPESRAQIACTTSNARIYGFGGSFTNGVTASVFEYDPMLDAWTALTPLATPISSSTAVSVGSSVLLVGGRDALGSAISSCSLFNVITHSWSSRPPLCIATGLGGAIVAKGSVYYAGGWTNDGPTDGVYCLSVDSTPPILPVVSDDASTQNTTTQLHSTWLSSDPESGIAEYQYAIGTTPTDPGSGYIVDWKSAGTSTEATETGLKLQIGQTYYWYVKAKNGAGLWSEVGVSDGIRVRLDVAPTISVGPPAIISCAGWSGDKTISLSADVADADGDELTLNWELDGSLAQTDVIEANGPPTADNRTFTFLLTPAVHHLVATVSDGTHSTTQVVIQLDPARSCSGSITGGSFHSAAVAPDGTVWTWGDNRSGELGNGSSSSEGVAVPAQVPGLEGFTAISAGWGHLLALKGDGTVWAWGDNQIGQLGIGWFSTESSPGVATPAAVPGISDVIAVAGGAYHTLALRNDGTVWAWGHNWTGSLGIGVYTYGPNYGIATPVQVQGLSRVVGIAADGYHSMALRADGTVWEWGTHAPGSTASHTATQVSGLSEITAIADGSGHALALKRDGSVWAWWWNGRGQLGDGTFVDSATPVLVANLPPAASVSAGYSHSLAFTLDGVAYGWGDNFNGQAGDGTRTLEEPYGIPLPSTVVGGTDVIAIAAGQYFALALKNDGSVIGWGQNQFGQLGSGTFNDPEGVTSPTTAIALPELTCAGSKPVVTVVDEGDVISSSVQLSAQWDVPGDSSGISEYRYSISTNPSDPADGVVLEWTCTTEPIATVTALSLEYGETYYWHVQARTNDCVISSIGHSNGILVDDGTSPIAPVVTDDGLLTISTSQIHATWSSTDPESGIAEYQYAIGTTPTDPGIGYIVGWKSAGTATEASETDLSLQNGQTCYWYVKAKNGAGQWSDVGVSDGILVEVTPPTTPVVVDDGTFAADLTQLHATWSSSDPDTGVAEYQFAFGTTPTDPGSGYIAGWQSAGTATEATEAGLELQSGQVYYCYVKASNGAGLWSGVGVSDGILVDATAPPIPLVTDDGLFTADTTQLHAAWSSSDPESGIAEYQYAIGTSPSDPGSGYAVGWKSAGTASEVSETGLSLQTGQRYYWYVKAKNGAGLWSDVGVSDGIKVGLPVLNPVNGHYYDVEFGNLLWTQAKPIAESRKYQGHQGYLATLTSPAELQWFRDNQAGVNPLSLDELWIGAYQDRNAPDFSEPNGGWRWVSDEPWSFTNWNPSGEPNEFLNLHEDFVMLHTKRDGTWYDLADDGAGYVDGFVVEYGTPDITPPTTPAVVDGGQYTASLTQLSASWSASDPEGQVVEYQYALGAAPTDPGTGYLVEWKSAGSATQATESNLLLVPNSTYYWYVRARNDAGLWSAVGVSDGIQYAPKVEWPVSQGGNGHLYQAVVAADGIRWNDADIEARRAGGYLVSITLEAENTFVHSLISGAPSLWGNQDDLGNTPGPWIGGWQPYLSSEPADGWKWVSGERFDYTNYLGGQPDNSGGAENRLQYLGLGSSPGPTWGDSAYSSIQPGYVIEYDPGLEQVYFNDFSGEPDLAWDYQGVDTAPGTEFHADDRFLGQLGRQAVTLSLVDLPSHNLARLTFDVYVLSSWDGNHFANGPDRFKVTADTNTLLDTTFSNIDRPLPYYYYQSFPENYPEGNNHPRSGATEVKSFGYNFGSFDVGSTIYRMTFVVPHFSQSLALSAEAIGLQAISDESWGIDNVQVHVLTDNTPPETEIVSGPSDGEVTSYSSATFEFAGSDDQPLTPSVRFSTKLDTGPWTSPTLATSVTCDGLLSGPHTFRVRAVDAAGNVDATPATRMWTVDTTPPSTPTVIDEGVYTDSLTQLSATRTASEPESQIVDFEYAVGTTPADPGTGYVVNWKSAGSSAGATETSLTLLSGQTYYWYVRARNDAGLWSAVGVSDGITVAQKLFTSPGKAKMQPDNTILGIRGVVVSAASGQIAGRVYVQAADRSSGIAVSTSSLVQTGEVVDVAGRTTTNTDGERILADAHVTPVSSQDEPVPLQMTLKVAAGGPWYYVALTGAGQRGVTDPPGHGLNSMGLLLQVVGWVADIDSNFAYINDGSWPSIAGVRVSRQYLPADIEINDLISVTGISSMRRAGLAYQLLIRPRQIGDIQVITRQPERTRFRK